MGAPVTAPYRITPVSGTERELWVRDAEGEGVAHVYGDTPEQAQERADAIAEALRDLREWVAVRANLRAIGLASPAPHVHPSAPDESCSCEQGEELL